MYKHNITAYFLGLVMSVVSLFLSFYNRCVLQSKLNAFMCTFEDFRELLLHGTLGSTGSVQPPDGSRMPPASEKAHDGSFHWLVRWHPVQDKHTYCISTLILLLKNSIVVYFFFHLNILYSMCIPACQYWHVKTVFWCLPAPSAHIRNAVRPICSARCRIRDQFSSRGSWC